MGTKKLRVLDVEVKDVKYVDSHSEVTCVSIWFSRKLTQLEISGVRAVLDGQIK